MKPERLENPHHYAGAYDLRLYCQWRVADGTEDFLRHDEPGVFLGESFGDAAKTARRRGWVIDKKNRLRHAPGARGAYHARRRGRD